MNGKDLDKYGREKPKSPHLKPFVWEKGRNTTMPPIDELSPTKLSKDAHDTEAAQYPGLAKSSRVYTSQAGKPVLTRSGLTRSKSVRLPTLSEMSHKEETTDSIAYSTPKLSGQYDKKEPLAAPSSRSGYTGIERSSSSASRLSSSFPTPMPLGSSEGSLPSPSLLGLTPFYLSRTLPAPEFFPLTGTLNQLLEDPKETSQAAPSTYLETPKGVAAEKTTTKTAPSSQLGT